MIKNGHIWVPGHNLGRLKWTNSGHVRTSKSALQLAKQVVGVVAGGQSRGDRRQTGSAEVSADARKDTFGGLASGEQRLKSIASEMARTGEGGVTR
jgi:hypothetical protein